MLSVPKRRKRSRNEANHERHWPNHLVKLRPTQDSCKPKEQREQYQRLEALKTNSEMPNHFGKQRVNFIACMFPSGKFARYIFLLLLLDLQHVISNPQSNLPSSGTGKSGSGIKTPSRTLSNLPDRTETQQSKRQPSETKSSLVEVYEHENYSKSGETANTWLGGSSPQKSHRWTSSATNHGYVRNLPPPSALSAPKGYAYDGDWKIDVTGGRKDELGWEYFVSGGVGRRRRRWVRNVLLETNIDNGLSIGKDAEDKEEEQRESEKMKAVKKMMSTQSSSTRTSNTSHKTVNASQKLFKELTDSFNFKGCGMTVNKSLLTKNLGIACRLPLSPHFDFWESRPHLPLLSSSFLLYYPLKISVVFNASLPVEILQSAILIGYDWSRWITAMLYCIIWQTILIDLLGKMILCNSIKAMGRILALGPEEADDSDDEDEAVDLRLQGPRGGSMDCKESTSALTVLGRKFPSMPQRRPITYNAGISDRLGVSVGMHMSKERGFEARCSWWHAVVPTVDYLTSKFYPSKTRKDQLSKWLTSKFASLGIVWGGYAPEAPHYSCSSLFSLSGLYPLEAWKKICNLQAKRKNREKISKKLDSHLRNDVDGMESESEYEEILEVKVGAS